MPKPVNQYYQHQSECRNIRTNEDVLKILKAVSPTYDRVFNPWLPSDTSVAIHEVACGPGILLCWLMSKGYINVTGCDIAANEVVLARMTGFDVTHGDAIADLERFNQELSTIFAINFIEHIPREAVIKFLRNAYAALRPGGNLILKMPNGDSPFVGRNLFNDITHEWAYTSTAFRAVSVMCGFSQIEFVDDTLVSICHKRWLKRPCMWLAQALLKGLFRAATHERFEYIGSSVYVCARKGFAK